ncbi:MAG: DUF6515 family protein [Candidatus Omnitrophica bacterium]|nr:DUF6515 family protein [Candidatus Omnitrophota bacterium]
MKRAICLIVVGSLLVMPCRQALAEHGGRHGGGHYSYDNGRYHRPGWTWFGIGATTLALGAVIASLSSRHEVVVVNGATYYYDDGVYYRPYSGGYVVVQQPVYVPASVVLATPVKLTPSDSIRDQFVVNILNSDRTYTSVTLVKSGSGYVGPQGEYYEGHPSVKQLEILYGK